MFRLIAVDIDGTLVGEDLVLSAKTVRIIEEIKKRGIYFTLATGRAFFSAIRFSRALQLTTPLITYGGALLSHPVSEEVYFKLPIPPLIARAAYKLLKELDLHVNIHNLAGVFAESLPPEADLYHSLTTTRIKLFEDINSLLADQPLKLLVVSALEEHLVKAEKVLKAKLKRQVNVARSLPQFMEVLNFEVSKGRALKILAKLLGVEQEEILAIGDSYNDLDMLQWAGCGVAMAIAPPQVKAVADHIAGMPGEDRLAEILETLVLKR